MDNHRIIKRDNNAVALDMTFILTMSFLFLVAVMIAFLNPITKNGVIDPPISMMVEAQWPSERDTDVDLYVRGPDGKVIYYANKSNGYITLKKDDLGKSTDKVVIDGVAVALPRNYEITTLTALPDGWYTVNAHLFTGPDETVTIRVTNILNYRIVYEGTFDLGRREEKTFIRFLVKDGRVVERDQQVEVKLRWSAQMSSASASGAPTPNIP